MRFRRSAVLAIICGQATAPMLKAGRIGCSLLMRNILAWDRMALGSDEQSLAVGL
jgi:hypothetical protein